MSRERKLLERIVTAWEDDRYELIDAMVDVVVDIKDYLANPPEPVNVYPFCGVVKMPEGWNTFANQETDTNPSETISNQEVDKPKREALQIDQKYTAWESAKLYGCSCRFSFFAGIRFAERHHGIGREE